MLKVQRQLIFTDVLEHADAYQLVEAAEFIQAAIVAQFYPALVL